MESEWVTLPSHPIYLHSHFISILGFSFSLFQVPVAPSRPRPIFRFPENYLFAKRINKEGKGSQVLVKGLGRLHSWATCIILKAENEKWKTKIVLRLLRTLHIPSLIPPSGKRNNQVCKHWKAKQGNTKRFNFWGGKEAEADFSLKSRLNSQT